MPNIKPVPTLREIAQEFEWSSWDIDIVAFDLDAIASDNLPCKLDEAGKNALIDKLVAGLIKVGDRLSFTAEAINRKASSSGNDTF